MKNALMRFRFTFGVLSLALAALLMNGFAAQEALSAEVVRNTIEWQKLDLEDKIQERISRALTPSIPETHFAIITAITLKPSADTKNAGAQKPARTAEEIVPLGKLVLDTSLLMASQAPQEQAAQAAPLFEQIESAEITLLLDQSLSEAKVEFARTVGKRALASLGRTAKANVNIQKSDLAPKVEPSPSPLAAQAEKTAAENVWDTNRWFTELKGPLTVLLTVALLGAIFLAVFRSYRGLESRRISLLEAKNNREESEFQTRIMAPPVQAGGAGGSADPVSRKITETMESGFDRFQKLLKDSPERAAQLVRLWLKTPRMEASEALGAIPQLLSLEQINEIFQHLSIEERKDWRQFLAGRKESGAPLKSTDSFVASQIVENLLVPEMKMDPSLREEINQLNTFTCIEIAKQDVELGALIANLLPSGQVARLLTLLPPDVANAITLASVRLSEEQMRTKSAALKTAIITRRNQTKKTPFLDIAADLMRDITPDRESAVFAAIVDSGDMHLLESTARQFFPAELILKLPPSVLRAAMETLSKERRAELIFSRGEDERATLLSCYGASGSRLREMMDIEITNVANDELRAKRAQKNQVLLWKELSDACRALLRRDPNAADYADSILSGWILEKNVGGSPLGKAA